MSEEIDTLLYGFPEDTQSFYIRFSEKDLLKGFREEALRHREEIKKLKELVIALWYNDNARFLNKEQIDLLNNIVFGNDEEDLGVIKSE